MRSHVQLCELLAAVLTASALVTAPASARAPAPPAQPLSAGQATLHWRPCRGAEEVQCATLRVPMDWARPRGAQVTLAVARRPAGDPSRRIGTLLYNHGGPGDSAVEYVLHADAVFSRTLRDRFDIVGMDPRAVGASTRVTCTVPLLAPDLTLLIVHATHDPSVPYKWAHSLAAQIEGSALLTRIGDGHTSSHTSACAIAAIDRYLVQPRAEADGVCRD